jgi:DNA repair exonuclease SbcCD ATPase subunit
LKPIWLKLENVFQHKNKEHHFRTGITGVMGRNGSGKSNFLEALHFAQTGNTGPGLQKGDLLSWGATAGQTVFEFEHNGNTYTLTRRLHTAYIKLEGDNMEKPLKASEANAFMEDVLGMSFKAFYETCWTPQGTLTSILTMSHAARVAFFQRLAQTRDAETIRGIIQENGINKLPAYPDRTEQIEEFMKEVNALGEQITGLETESQNVELLFHEFTQELVPTQKILALPTEASHQEKVGLAEELLIKDRTALKAAQDAQGITEVPRADPPSTAMEALKTASERRVVLLQKKQDLEKANADLQATMPVAVEDPDPIRLELEEDNKKIGEKVPEASLAKNKTCPTCQRPFEFEGGEAAREKVLKEYGDLLAAYNVKHAAYTQKKADFDRWQRNTQTVQNSITVNGRLMAPIDDELALVQDVVFDPTEYNTQLQAYQAYMKYLRDKEGNEAFLKGLQDAVSTSEGVLSRAQSEEFATVAIRQAADEFMSNYSELQERRQTAATNASAAVARKQTLEEQLHQQEQEQVSRQEVTHLRNLFVRAREKLHRDQLPSLVMQKVLHGLNALLDQYLNVFDVNFSSYINEEFDFMCSFAAKSDVPARSLSGGQKVSLSLAFKFAVSDLLGSSVPFLVLDEPTVWLDDTNKPRLAEVLTKARSVTEKTGYAFVATHEHLLIPAFSRVYDVS